MNITLGNNTASTRVNTWKQARLQSGLLIGSLALAVATAVGLGAFDRDNAGPVAQSLPQAPAIEAPVVRAATSSVSAFSTGEPEQAVFFYLVGSELAAGTLAGYDEAQGNGDDRFFRIVSTPEQEAAAMNQIATATAELASLGIPVHVIDAR